VPIVHAGGNYLPGIYYVRVFFEAGDERGCPWYAPLQEEDHLAAYRPFLHPSKEAAIDSVRRNKGQSGLTQSTCPSRSHQ
jgi:hypothetical protein